MFERSGTSGSGSFGSGGFGLRGFGAGGGMPPPAGSGLLLFVPGALFAGLGVAILLVPELFRYLVAVLCLGIGGVLTLAALQLRRARRQQQRQGLAQNLMAWFRVDRPD